MNAAIANTATSLVGSRLLKGFRFSWIMYGVAAYYGLKYLNKKGILTKQTDVALDLVDKGIGYAKGQIGLGTSKNGKSPTGLKGELSSARR